MIDLQDIFFIVPSAGTGARMKVDIPKQYILHDNKPILYYTIQALAELNIPIILVVSPDDEHIEKYQDLLFTITSNLEIIAQGGASRSQTVSAGLNYLINKLHLVDKNYNPWVLVHDAARPLVSKHDIEVLIKYCTEKQISAILATPSTDTLKKINNNRIITTINRDNVICAQTPQMFKLKVLQSAFSVNDVSIFSDEAMAVQALNIPVDIVIGNPQNIKITYPSDIEFFSFLIKNRNNN